jgi:hypothetical protein
MSINYIGADADCMITEIAIEKNGKITARDRVPQILDLSENVSI